METLSLKQRSQMGSTVQSYSTDVFCLTSILIKIKAALKKSSDFYIIGGKKIQILTCLEKSLKTLHSREPAMGRAFL